MPGLQRFQPPSPDNTAAWAAEQRWLYEDARLVREIQIIGLSLGAVLAILGVGVAFALRGLAILCVIACCGGMARIIYLIVKRYRMFLDIKTAAGMARKEAIAEFISRYSD